MGLFKLARKPLVTPAPTATLIRQPEEVYRLAIPDEVSDGERAHLRALEEELSIADTQVRQFSGALEIAELRQVWLRESHSSTVEALGQALDLIAAITEKGTGIVLLPAEYVLLREINERYESAMRLEQQTQQRYVS